MKANMKKHPLISSLVIAVLMYLLIFAVQKLPLTGLYVGALYNLIAAVPVLLIFIYLFGKEPVKFSLTGMGYGLRKGFLFFLIMGTLEGVAVFCSLYLVQNYAFEEHALAAFLWIVLQCFLLGIFEEFLFRGILLNLPLTVFRDTRARVVRVVIIESLLFGFFHCVDSFFTGGMTPAMFLQVILKTLQTGIMGFVFSALTLKIRNLWPAVLFHGYFDLCLLAAPMILKAGESVSGGYVNGDTSSSVVYIIDIVIMIPALIHSIKMLKTLEIPCVIAGDEDFKPGIRCL